jgi:hypothetical protein
VDDDLTPDEEAALLVALLRWRVQAGIDGAQLVAAADDASR